MVDQIGIVLSEATTNEAKCQLLRDAERGKVYEGMLVIVERKSPPARILARVAQVIPFNDFYTDGDAWSESRRQGTPIPSDVARKWEICVLDLLRDLSRSSPSITFPPSPGDKVLEIDPAANRNDIFDVTDDQKGIVWIGALTGYTDDIPLPINVEHLPMHLAIFGITGSGKSFTAGVLVEKLLRIRVRKNRTVSYPMVLVDAHGDYVNYVDEFQAASRLQSDNDANWTGAASWFQRLVFPSSQKLREEPSEYVKPIGVDLGLLNPGEVAHLIVEFYKGETATSVLQVAGIARILDDLRAEGHSLNSLFEDTTLLRQRIGSSDQVHQATRDAIARAIDYFVSVVEQQHHLLSTDSMLKSENFVERITTERGVAILDFSADGAPGVDLPTKQLVMTYVAKLLFNRFSAFKRLGQTRYLLFMIEEAQNFCPSKSYSVGETMSHSTLQAIATQGRKFGLSLCLISQRPAFLDPVIVSMCNSFFIHRVSPEDVSFVRKVTGGLPSSLSSRLTNLGKGELIVHGQITTIPFPMLIRIPKKQRHVDHVTGTTNVVEGIAEASGIDLSEED